MHADAEQFSPTDGNVSPGAALPADGQIAYNVPHVAKVLDLSERQVWAFIRNGDIESFKIGASRRVTRGALVDFINRQHETAVA